MAAADGRCGGMKAAEAEHMAEITRALGEEALLAAVLAEIGGDAIEVLSANVQVVAGLNFFVKVRHGEGKIAHLRIYWNFRSYALSSAKTGETLDSPMLYF